MAEVVFQYTHVLVLVVQKLGANSVFLVHVKSSIVMQNIQKITKSSVSIIGPHPILVLLKTPISPVTCLKT